ncbi:protein RarD [Corynebacterium deserti GIMN1.010]|uniref:Protein RarD n=1 Tax=Corynebacterium deserti GIMN1.010 TaxID=931089 RepID=A0A0M4CJQ3_9CORY|nr:permease [Corynebacterium deserti]ALC04647.1 protein RarD [Corynebacterium deserti GIMN1.010]
MATERTSPAGVITSLLASALFGAIFFISGAIEAKAETLVAWRVILTAACYILILTIPAGRRLLNEFWNVLRKGPMQLVYFVLLVALIALQLWLFSWSPKGHALDASLGYLLLPIFLVVVGRVFFSSAITRLQWIAVSIAVVAVCIKFIMSAHLSWVTFAIAGGYALYFAIRRYSGLNNAFAYGVETIVLSPIAFFLLFTVSDPLDSGMLALVIIAGLAGAVAMALYLAASVLLSMPMFGLLSYGEPILLFVAALLLGESLNLSDAIVYSLLALALGVLGFDGLARSRKVPSDRG